MISRQKQNKHSICGKENWRIHQAVLADVRVLGEVASVRCVSCASSFCLNILLRLDMTHTDLSPSPAPPITDASTRRPVFLLHRPSGLLGQGPSQRPRGRPHNAPSLLREFKFLNFEWRNFFFQERVTAKRRGGN
jgi:hypothetical protein